MRRDASSARVRTMTRVTNIVVNPIAISSSGISIEEWIDGMPILVTLAG